ncbi:MULTISPECIES: ATP-binding protein [Corynebacterium]|uniref:ATP-binding protein n=1 Tax=Corynebacterium TaxID=1716 RepID=UPI00210C2612|nr:ATP-binding protein [Corynebacterium sp. UMB10119B]MCQ4615946.1 ATP-binding protein [Corynebacterium pseudogenitalium]MDK8362883.1 ATP-binding protein [Corynebacterium sp. UMB10119B]
MFIPRELGQHLEQLASWFPIVSVTGPRQSGKSTLIREQFPDFTYLNLEDPTLRALATEDPTGFIHDRGSALIIDEAQYAPELFSSLQVISDERGTPGQYVLSGSQNFLLMEKISQSLAGRVGITHLLPLSFQEALTTRPDMSTEAFMVRGGYPRLYQVDMPPEIYYQNYLRTYVERDVTQLLNVQNAEAFQKMMKLLALNAGSLINYTGLARELGVAFATVKNWVSILESSFIVFALRPFHTNSRKTLTKTPKLYFYDTGLLCHLLGLRTKADLVNSPAFGAVMENLIVAETAKCYHHQGIAPELYFYRDDSKIEVDLLDMTHEPRAVEIKSSVTFRSRYGRNVATVGSQLSIDPAQRWVVYRGEHRQQLEEFKVLPASEYLRQDFASPSNQVR